LDFWIFGCFGCFGFGGGRYRALAAADNAVMLLDAAKGLEPQTRKLFEVARMRGLPLFTFVNKMDRPALSPYDIMDQIEEEFGLETHPIFWPIGDGDRFRGVLDRTTDVVHFFQKSSTRGGKAIQREVPLDDVDAVRELVDDPELFDKLYEDHELLEGLLPELDMERVMAADQSPLFFGSAMNNFGVQLFLDKFMAMGTSPAMREALVGDSKDKAEETAVEPGDDEFSGFVFKTQANLDPKHRDRLAFVRIVSGTYTRGLKVGHSRSKNNKR